MKEVTATLFKEGTMEPEVVVRAGSLQDALKELLRQRPLRLRMYGSPLITPDHFKACQFIGRNYNQHWEKYRMSVDLNRNENRLPEMRYVEICERWRRFN